MKRVPPFGSLDSKICFIGQSPGKHEAKFNRPFIGKAGQILRKLCRDVEINPDACYWTNICDRVLLGTDSPTEEDISEGRIRLKHELKKLENLKIVVLVGIPASQLVFTGLMREMSRQEGELFGHKCIAIYHPSSILRARGGEHAQKIREEIKFVLKKVKILSELKPNTQTEGIDLLKTNPYKNRYIIIPTRRSGIAELLGSKPLVSEKAPKREASTIPEPDNWLKNILDETLEKQQKLWEEPVRYFRGSEVGDPCLISLCLSAMGHRMPIAANLRRIFNTGLAIEKSNIYTFTKAGIFKGQGQEDVVYIKPPIRGHIDGMVYNPDNKKLYLAEIKSINEYAFNKLPKEHGPMLASESSLFQVYYKYIMQWNCYCCAPNIELNDGFLLFEAKNTQAQKYYWLKRDDELLEKMLARLQLAAPYILSDPMRVPPKSINEKDEPEHKYCIRRYLCNALPDDGCDYETVRKIDRELRG